MSATTGGSVYETWVLTLRAWAKDPRTSLDYLPPLDANTFTPATYQRLIKHLIESIDAASVRWIEALQTAFEHASSPAELATELVSLRPVLARRSQLASHPSLPQEVRDALAASMRRDVERVQRDMEESIQKRSSAACLDTTSAERMLQVVRENSFIAVLDRNFTDDGGRLQVAPLPHAVEEKTSTSRRFRPQRIVKTPNNE